MGYSLNIFTDDDLIDKKKMIFKEYNFKWISIRIVFFILLFLVSLKTLLKKNMESLRVISVIFLFSMCLLLISVVL